MRIVTPMRSSRAIVCLGGVLLAACGGSDPSAELSSAPVADTAAIDYADGAFVANDGSAEPGADAPAATDASSPGGTAADGGGDDDPATAASTTVAADGGGGNGGGGATGTTAAPSGSTTVTTAGGTTGSSSQLAVGTGIVQIGDVMYPFVAEECEIDSLGFFLFGYGTSSAGDPVEVDISGDTDDVDGDGTPDVNFDMYVVPDLDAGDSVSSLPDFFASKVETSTYTEGEDVELVITGTTVSGSGPIEDFNGVAIPIGETRPMTFEVRCA